MNQLESSLWLSGLLLIAIFLLGAYRRDLVRQESVQEFERAKQVALLTPKAPDRKAPPMPLARQAKPAVPIPSEADWQLEQAPGAVAVLRIARLDMEVPVHDGTDESVLSRGAGLVEGTARPGGGGNIAIAAHRDSFFRGLRDVAYGDLIELESFQRKATYRVSALAVVEPDDVQVLAETGEAALTLVTCYPFHFVGHAPQRFIVRAVATDLTPPVSRR